MEHLILVNVCWTNRAFMTRAELAAGFAVHALMLRQLGGPCDHGRLGACCDCSGENGTIRAA